MGRSFIARVEEVMYMSGVEVRPPDMEALSHWVREYAPVVLSWCVMALVVSVALRLVLAIFGKHSHLLRGISYMALVGGVAALGGYWILTGEVPHMVSEFERWLGGIDFKAIGIKDFDLGGLPERVAHVDLKGIVTLAAGAVLAFFSRPLSRIFSRGEGSGDVDIVIKTIGLLLAVLGALIVFGVL